MAWLRYDKVGWFYIYIVPVVRLMIIMIIVLYITIFKHTQNRVPLATTSVSEAGRKLVLGSLLRMTCLFAGEWCIPGARCCLTDSHWSRCPPHSPRLGPGEASPPPWPRTSRSRLSWGSHSAPPRQGAQCGGGRRGAGWAAPWGGSQSPAPAPPSRHCTDNWDNWPRLRPGNEFPSRLWRHTSSHWGNQQRQAQVEICSDISNAIFPYKFIDPSLYLTFDLSNFWGIYQNSLVMGQFLSVQASAWCHAEQCASVRLVTPVPSQPHPPLPPVLSPWPLSWHVLSLVTWTCWCGPLIGCIRCEYMSYRIVLATWAMSPTLQPLSSWRDYQLSHLLFRFRHFDIWVTTTGAPRDARFKRFRLISSIGPDTKDDTLCLVWITSQAIIYCFIIDT